jgi:glycosyltransferase involved in cell wall biosynthesis
VRAPRALVVTTVHPPLDARIHDRQIRALVAAGWDVTFAAPFDATGTAEAAVLEGVTMVDLPRARGRARLGALVAARRAIAARGASSDVVLLHDPELLLAVPRRLRRRAVLDVHEDLAASLVDRAWMPRWLRPVAAAAVRRLERWAERHVTLLLAEEAYQHRFARRHTVVRNLPWLPPDDRPDERRDVVVYVGRISASRGLREMLMVAEQLRSRGGPTLELIGSADADVEAALRRAQDAGTVRWSGFLPNEEALARVDGAVAGLALLHDLPNYRVSLPTKLVEYLARGVPVITTPLPAAVSLVERSGAGTVVHFGAIGEVVDEVLRLRDDGPRRVALAAAGRRFVQAGWSWDDEQHRFLDALDAAVRERAGRG